MVISSLICEIAVADVPEVVLTRPTDGLVIIGNPIELNCSFNASAPPTVLWKKGAEVIVNSSGNVIINDSRLTVNAQPSYQILSVSSSVKKDGGNYTCVVGNSIGNISAKSALIVIQSECFTLFIISYVNASSYQSLKRSPPPLPSENTCFFLYLLIR